jgi:hypothetical protein
MSEVDTGWRPDSNPHDTGSGWCVEWSTDRHGVAVMIDSRTGELMMASVVKPECVARERRIAQGKAIAELARRKLRDLKMEKL